MYHVFSFFEGKQHLTHFATEQDVADEFIALLSEARDFYLQDVIVNGKRYDRYVDTRSGVTLKNNPAKHNPEY